MHNSFNNIVGARLLEQDWSLDWVDVLLGESLPLVLVRFLLVQLCLQRVVDYVLVQLLDDGHVSSVRVDRHEVLHVLLHLAEGGILNDVLIDHRLGGLVDLREHQVDLVLFDLSLSEVFIGCYELWLDVFTVNLEFVHVNLLSVHQAVLVH